MKKHKTFMAICAAGCLIMMSCSKSGPTGATGPSGGNGPAGPALTGTVTGYVDLYDQYGDLLSPGNGVKITIPTMASVNDTTIVDGMYTIPGLSTGVYEIDFSKTNYGSTKINSFGFTGGGTQYIAAHMQMTQPPIFTLATTSALTATSNTVSSQVAMAVTMAATDTKMRKVAVFYSNAATVSSTPGNYMGWSAITIPANTTTANMNLSSSATFYPSGLSSGTTAYFIVYPISYNTGASTYPDPATGKTVFNNLNTASSFTATAVIP